MNKTVYLSPHLDDAVLSCGAIIWDQIRRHNQVEIWTIFAGDSLQPELSPFAREIHQRWQTGDSAPSLRRAEDNLACERLGVVPQHLPYPDCIYRRVPGTDRPLIEKKEDLFQPLSESERPLVDEIVRHIRQNLPSEATLVIPLGIGNHIDHQIVRQVGEVLNPSRFHYADFPYSAGHTEELQQLLPQGSSTFHFPINNQSLAAWQFAIEAYTSQLSSFWSSLSGMYNSLDAYAKTPLGNCLWQSDRTETLLK
jgi:LmbE family N-acetylglucosaminyl deacetylase